MHGLNTLKQIFDDYLHDHQIQREPQALYDPFNYIMNIGGKRMRPIMTLLACQLFSKEITNALPAALSVEVFHNFSLVHDDIMDAAPLRRGQPAVHAKYGLNSGILSGDVMLIFAYHYLHLTPRQAAVNELVKTLTQVAIQVCEGQQYDIDFEQRDNVSLAEYLQMIEMKTAALLAGSLEMGAIAGGAGIEDRQHLREFGRLTGIAFQIQDDFLDTFGDPEKVGKRPGGDILQNKKTCLIIKALELADAPTRDQLLKFYAQQSTEDEEKVRTVTAIFRELGIPEFLRALRNDYQQRAYAHLEQVKAPKEGKDLLFGLAESLLLREL